MTTVTVVVPAYNAEATLRDCLRALSTQSLPGTEYEVIVVDDGSSDATAAIAEEFRVRLIRQQNRGAAAARNTGWRAAETEWVAFTDADCIPTRGWLDALLRAAKADRGEPAALGVAGKVIGYESNSPAARFVDLVAALDAERHLSHPRYPFAPSGNVMYRRDALEAVGGYDERYRTYEACDLHARFRKRGGDRFLVASRAVVFHRHRATWKAFWRQQFWYGVGYAQFMCHRLDEIRWSPWDEARTWSSICALGIRASLPGKGDELLVRRGTFVKQLAQRLGFIATYWSRTERARWC